MRLEAWSGGEVLWISKFSLSFYIFCFREAALDSEEKFHRWLAGWLANDVKVKKSWRLRRFLLIGFGLNRFLFLIISFLTRRQEWETSEKNWNWVIMMELLWNQIKLFWKSFDFIFENILLILFIRLLFACFSHRVLIFVLWDISISFSSRFIICSFSSFSRRHCLDWLDYNHAHVDDVEYALCVRICFSM